MKNFFKNIISALVREENERRLIIILPCLAVMMCALILAPELRALRHNLKAVAASAELSPAAEAALSSPPEGDEAEAEYIPVYLTATSGGEDLFISVCGGDGAPISGTRFTLTLTTPTGDEIICATYADGSCYLVELLPGEYTIRMSPQEGYRAAEDIRCQVSSATHEAPSLEELEPGLNIVEGKLYYLGADGRAARAVGLDLSCYNGRIDWELIKAQGIDFVILRLGGRGWGSGLIYSDTRFLEYFDAAKAAGLNVGVYFYSTAINQHEAIEEAEYIMDKLRGAPLELPVFLDCEYSGSYPNGRADMLGRDTRGEIITAFSKTLTSRGYRAGFYSGSYYISHELDRAALAGQCVWIANYTKNNALPAVDFRYDIWQYTANGRIAGVFGPVDINVVF